jgi:hypothetical protein
MLSLCRKAVPATWLSGRISQARDHRPNKRRGQTGKSTKDMFLFLDIRTKVLGWRDNKAKKKDQRSAWSSRAFIAGFFNGAVISPVAANASRQVHNPRF